MKAKILKITRNIFLSAALLFMAIFFTGANYSDSVPSSGNALRAGSWDVPTPAVANVVINEIMANPINNANGEMGPMPDGEWVELYNTGMASADVNGWYLYDDYDSHALQITLSNVIGSTNIAPGGYLVVFRNMDVDFSLNNGGDTIRLYGGPIFTSTLIDSTIYPSALIENLTWARLPDGTGGWTNNHTPTPGGPNL